jgi:hypothetical protein
MKSHEVVCDTQRPSPKTTMGQKNIQSNQEVQEPYTNTKTLLANCWKKEKKEEEKNEETFIPKAENKEDR